MSSVYLTDLTRTCRLDQYFTDMTFLRMGQYFIDLLSTDLTCTCFSCEWDVIFRPIRISVIYFCNSSLFFGYVQIINKIKDQRHSLYNASQLFTLLLGWVSSNKGAEVYICFCLEVTIFLKVRRLQPAMANRKCDTLQTKLLVTKVDGSKPKISFIELSIPSAIIFANTKQC